MVEIKMILPDKILKSQGSFAVKKSTEVEIQKFRKHLDKYLTQNKIVKRNQSLMPNKTSKGICKTRVYHTVTKPSVNKDINSNLHNKHTDNNQNMNFSSKYFPNLKRCQSVTLPRSTKARINSRTRKLNSNFDVKPSKRNTPKCSKRSREELLDSLINSPW